MGSSLAGDDPNVMHELQELCWLITEFWLTNLEVNGRNMDEREMQNGVKLMLRVLQPYLTSGSMLLS